MNEVEQHLHNRERELTQIIDDVPQPAPAPRLSRTPGQAMPARGRQGANTKTILIELGYTTDEVKGFFEAEIVE